MSAEYKVTKGIYMRKYQAKKYLGSRWCVRGETEDSKEFRNVNFTLRNWSFGMMQLPSEGHIFLISAPNHTRFEALDF